MDYLTVKETAELKDCSIQYVKKLCKDGKFQTKQELNCKGRMKYLIPVSALPEDLQTKYYASLKKEIGLAPELKEEKEPLKKPLRTSKKSFEEYSEAERNEMAEWCDILREWQELRTHYKKKTEFDADFVGKCRIEHPELNISESILYKKYKAYLNNDYDALIDKRGGWNRGKSKLDDDSIIWRSFLQVYLEESKPKVDFCYKMVCAFIARKYPELRDDIPSVSSFRRKIKTLPFAVLEYSREGNKAMHDHCTPHATRMKDKIYANSIWVMDNYTFDIIIKEDNNPKKTKRMYLTTVLDVKSGVLVGWNITDTPDSHSTLLALRFAMLRFGIPERLYFDNGREFTTLDMAGDERNRKVAKDKKGNLPETIMKKLGIEIIFALPTNAQAKVVERIHRIIKEQFCCGQYGYCGGNVLERPESLKRRIKNGNIETESELYEAFENYADNVLNVAEYGGGERKYKGMTAIDVWNESIAETSIRRASEDVLNLLMLRNSGFQKVKRNGIFISYHGEKIWYYDEYETWKHINEKVCVRYNPDDLRTVRIYDTDERFLFEWKLADWMITEYINEENEKLAELGRKKSGINKRIIRRCKELKGNLLITQKSGINHIAIQNEGKFEIRQPKNIIPITTSEPMPKAVNDEYVSVPVNLKNIVQCARKQKGEF